MRSNRIFWAIVLVGLGFLLLADNLGFVNINIWGLFWPALLILLGIWFLIGTATGATNIEMLEGSVDLDGAESALITVKHGAGKLSLDSSAASGQLVSGTFANGLDARVTKDGTRLKVVMQPQHQAFPDLFFPGNWMSGRGLMWDFGLSKELPLDLVFETGAVEAQLDLTDLQVKDLVLKTGASSTDIKLPAGAGFTHLKIEAGAASVVLHVPKGVAARVEAQAGFASVSVDQNRFPKQNGYYQSADYEGAKNKVDIRIETGMASIEVK